MISALPTTITAALIAACAALGAALLAYLAARTNAKIAKENARLQARIAQRIKRAEFRQVWINALRDSFVSLSHSINSKSESSESNYIESTIMILLLMNNADPDYEDLKLSMANLADEAIGKSKTGASLKYIALCQKILKREWDVTKGELALLEAEFS